MCPELTTLNDLKDQVKFLREHEVQLIQSFESLIRRINHVREMRLSAEKDLNEMQASKA